MVHHKGDQSNKNGSNQIRLGKSVEAGSTTDDGDNFGIICHSGGKINHRNKNQDGKKGHHQINNPEGIEMDQEIHQIQFRINGFGIFYPWNFLLYINYQDNYRQQYKHETESSKVFFYDISVYNFKHIFL